MPAVPRDQVFVCYSHRDREWLDRLEAHLVPLIGRERLSAWSEARLRNAAPADLEESLSRARVGLLLVSPTLLSSTHLLAAVVRLTTTRDRRDRLTLRRLVVQPTESLGVLSATSPVPQKAALSLLPHDEQEQTLAQVARELRDTLGPQSAWQSSPSGIIDFSAERARYATMFGREEVANAIDGAWRSSPAPSGWVLVTGSPAMGKSALLSSLLARLEAEGQYAPHHFVRRGYSDWDQPAAIERSLVAQIEARFPGQDFSSIASGSLSARLELLSERVLVPEGKRLLLAIDGVDNAVPPPATTNPLPLFLPTRLPPGVFALCTARNGYPHLGWLCGREQLLLHVDLDSPKWSGSNRRACRSFWEFHAGRFAPPLDAAFVEGVLERVGGNLLYASRLRAWLERQPLSQRRLDRIPAGLPAFLEQLWVGLGHLPKPEGEEAMAALGVLRVAREALPKSALDGAMGWTADEGERFLDRTRDFLLLQPAHWGGGEPSIQLFHESYSAFIGVKLGDEKLRASHVQAAEGLAAWPSIGGAFHEAYALRHGLHHRVEGGDWGAVRTLATDVSYLQAMCLREGVAATEKLLAAAGARCPDLETRRVLQTLGKALRHEAKMLQHDPELLPILLYNRLRGAGWEPDRIASTLRFVEGPPAVRLRHAVQRDLSGSLDDGQTEKGALIEVGIHADGRTALAGHNNGNVKLIDLQSGRSLHEFRAHKEPMVSCALSPDAHLAATGCVDHLIRIWSLGWGQGQEVEGGQPVSAVLRDELRGHRGPVWDCAFSPDGRRLASAGHDGLVIVWNLDLDDGTVSLEPHDGEHFIRLVSPMLIADHSHRINTVAFTPDGDRLVSGSDDRTVRVWDLSRKRHQVLEGHRGSVACCAVTPDGRSAVSASEDRTLRLWDLEQGTLIETLEGHTSQVHACAISPDGRLLVSASEDRTLRLWDLHRRRALQTVTGTTAYLAVRCLDDVIVAGDAAGNLWVLDIAKEALFTRSATVGRPAPVRAPAPSSLFVDAPPRPPSRADRAEFEAKRELLPRSGALFELATPGEIFRGGPDVKTIQPAQAPSAIRTGSEVYRTPDLPSEPQASDVRTRGAGTGAAAEPIDRDARPGGRIATGEAELPENPGAAPVAGPGTGAGRPPDPPLPQQSPPAAYEMNPVEAPTSSSSHGPSGTGLLDRLKSLLSWTDTDRHPSTAATAAVLAKGATPPLDDVLEPEAEASEGDEEADLPSQRDALSTFTWQSPAASPEVSPVDPAPASSRTVHYVNAKVVLVGDSGVGKSGLGIYMAEGGFRATESTHGAQFWQLPVVGHGRDGSSGGDELRAEITLWDLAGQPDYHLVHQLFLDDTDAALLVFDASDPAAPFRGASYWARVLQKHTRPGALKFLVSARCDVCPVTIDKRRIQRFLSDYGLDDHFPTSARTGQGIPELIARLHADIPWASLPRTSTPKLFQVIRELLLEHRSEGDIVLSLAELRRVVRRRYLERDAAPDEIDAVVAHLQGQGLVHRLQPTPQLVLVLLAPERINQYASAILRAARCHPRGIGALAERDVICAQFDLAGVERLDPDEEKSVLEATVELFIQHDLCFREMGMLVFPSQLNVDPPESRGDPPVGEVRYRFKGALERIYASMVVRLSLTSDFTREDCWKYVAEFGCRGSRLGFAMQQDGETATLDIYFYPGVDEFDRVTFIKFITDHLKARGVDIEEQIRLFCPKCRKEQQRETVEERVRAGKLDIGCPVCDTRVLIPRSIEERYRLDRAVQDKQRQLQERVQMRTEQEIDAFKDDRQYTSAQDTRLRILHLSDLHLGTLDDAKLYFSQLKDDLRDELQVRRLDYLVLSGDIADRCTEAEYAAAFDFVDRLVKHFGLDSSRVVCVPGNHDLSWDLAKQAYAFTFRSDLAGPPPEERHIPAGDVGVLIRDEARYLKRFDPFNQHFYRKIRGGETYPEAYDAQGLVYAFPQDRLLFVGLNSSWHIDHHFRGRAGIHDGALSGAIDGLDGIDHAGWLKIAVWHHPVAGREGMNDAFLQRLSVKGFRIAMHGHIHEAGQGFYHYDPKRSIHVVGAGTFGAPAAEQVPGIPLQYQLLVYDAPAKKVVVETRKKEKPSGAWSADARWGDRNAPAPRYEIGDLF